MKKQGKPKICPVCKGRGTLTVHHWGIGECQEKCPKCKGRGVKQW